MKATVPLINCPRGDGQKTSHHLGWDAKTNTASSTSSGEFV